MIYSYLFHRNIVVFTVSKSFNVTSRFTYIFNRQMVRRRFGFHVRERDGVINPRFLQLLTEQVI